MEHSANVFHVILAVNVEIERGQPEVGVVQTLYKQHVLIQLGVVLDHTLHVYFDEIHQAAEEEVGSQGVPLLLPEVVSQSDDVGGYFAVSAEQHMSRNLDKPLKEDEAPDFGETLLLEEGVDDVVFH